MKKSAFTLVEVLVVVSILVLIAAIAFPVFSKVQRRAKEANSVAHMHQIWVALMAYRSDYETGGGGDMISSLGLPPHLITLVEDRKIPVAVIHTGGSSEGPNLPDVYTWLIPGEATNPWRPSWKTYYDSEGENCVFILDDTFGNEPFAKFHPFDFHHVFATHLDGHTSVKNGTGNYTSFNFWKSK